MSTQPRNHFPIRINRSANQTHSQALCGQPQIDKHLTDQVDHYLQTTYKGLITNKINSLCKPQFAPTNSLLINYIRHIYSKYALEDPMKKYGDQRYWGSAENMQSSTQKHPQYQIIMQQQPHMQFTQPQVNPEAHISQSRYVTPKKSVMDSQITGVNQSAAQSAGQGKTSFGFSAGQSVGNSRLDNTIEIQAVFRYCFECEKSILEYNMLNHEKNCTGFMALYQKTTPQIIELLETKIQRIKQQVIAVLNCKEDSKLNGLKPATTAWLARVQQCQNSKLLSLEFERDYGRIKDCYKSSELMILELSYKLRWFMRIREEIKKKFEI